ncbi:unnamed protein product [Parnassius mnemosyne]
MASVRAVIAEFIEKYHECECLWKINNPFYKNKQKRLSALEALLQILRKQDKNANMDSVTKKINNLRCAFKKEHNKIKATNRSGVGTDELYISKLWFYDLIMFLSESDNASRSSKDIDEILNEIATTDNQDDVDTNTEEQMEEECNQSACRTSISQQNYPRQINIAKRKVKNAATEVLSKISNRLDSPVTKSKPPYSAFGEHVAEKLRSMNQDAAKYCQKIINDAIFYAEFNNLNYTSHIVTDYLQHPQSPYQSSHQRSRFSPSSSSQTQSPPSHQHLASPSILNQPHYQSSQLRSRFSPSPSSQTQSPPSHQHLASPSILNQQPHQSSHKQSRFLASPSPHQQLPIASSSVQNKSHYQSSHQRSIFLTSPSSQTQSPPSHQHLPSPSILNQPPHQSSHEQSRFSASPSPHQQLPIASSSVQNKSHYQSSHQRSTFLTSPSYQTQSPPSHQHLLSPSILNEQPHQSSQEQSRFLASPSPHQQLPIASSSVQNKSHYQSSHQRSIFLTSPSSQTQSPPSHQHLPSPSILNQPPHQSSHEQSRFLASPSPHQQLPLASSSVQNQSSYISLFGPETP